MVALLKRFAALVHRIFGSSPQSKKPLLTPSDPLSDWRRGPENPPREKSSEEQLVVDGLGPKPTATATSQIGEATADAAIGALAPPTAEGNRAFGDTQHIDHAVPDISLVLAGEVEGGSDKPEGMAGGFSSDAESGMRERSQMPTRSITLDAAPQPGPTPIGETENAVSEHLSDIELRSVADRGRMD
jgi:hypothetical protein